MSASVQLFAHNALLYSVIANETDFGQLQNELQKPRTSAKSVANEIQSIKMQGIMYFK